MNEIFKLTLRRTLSEGTKFTRKIYNRFRGGGGGRYNCCPLFNMFNIFLSSFLTSRFGNLRIVRKDLGFRDRQTGRPSRRKRDVRVQSDPHFAHCGHRHLERTRLEADALLHEKRLRLLLRHRRSGRWRWFGQRAVHHRSVGRPAADLMVLQQPW